MAVFKELTSNTKFAEEAEKIKGCKFIKVITIDEDKSVDRLRRITGLDLGESEAIILSDNLQADLLLMDEAKWELPCRFLYKFKDGKYEVYLSMVTLKEIQKCPETKRHSSLTV